MAILYAGLVLGGIGLVFGLILTFASKAFHVDVDERVQQVRACCAGANCGACGYAGCDGFAEAVVKGEAPVNGCKPAGAEGAKKIAAIMGVDAGASEERQVARVRCRASRAWPRSAIPTTAIAAAPWRRASRAAPRTAGLPASAWAIAWITAPLVRSPCRMAWRTSMKKSALPAARAWKPARAA